MNPRKLVGNPNWKKGVSANPDTQFKPGESGNPNGPEEGYTTFKNRIRQLANKPIDYKDLANKKIKTSVGDAVIIALMGKAIYKHDTQAMKTLIEFADGKAVSEVKAEIKLDALTSLFQDIGAVEKDD